MNALETEMDISSSSRDNFRKEIWALKADFDGKLSYSDDPRMRRGIENYLMKTNSDLNIPMSMLDKGDTADAETKRKISTIMERLINIPDEDGMGTYNETSALIAMSRAALPKNRKSDFS